MNGLKKKTRIKKKPKIYVVYVKNSTPTIKEFKTLKAAKEFIKKFHVNTANGDWVDFLVVGKLKTYDSICWSK